MDRGGAEIFRLNIPTKTREKLKINGKYFHMQVDTGSDIILISANRFAIIPITVVACTRNHGLQGIDLLKVDTSN